MSKTFFFYSILPGLTSNNNYSDHLLNNTDRICTHRQISRQQNLDVVCVGGTIPRPPQPERQRPVDDTQQHG